MKDLLYTQVMLIYSTTIIEAFSKRVELFGHKQMH